MATVDEITFTKVRLPYGWLGNMAPYPLMYEGNAWLTSEALFQALRFADAAADDTSHRRALVREEIRSSRSPMAAKMVAKRNVGLMTVNPRSPSDVDNMFHVLGLKVIQHPSLLRQLYETNNSRIIEDCTARANESGLFWGAAKVDGRWKGKNTLGELWMKLRDDLKKVSFSIVGSANG